MTGKSLRMLSSFRSSLRSGKGRDCTSLPQLITKQKWDDVMRMITSSDREAVVEFVRNPSTGRSSDGESTSTPEPVESILHLSCRFHPPTAVVQFLLDVNPRAAFETDRMGRLPLHIAAKAGASPIVIKFLLLKNPGAANGKDVMEKTPLHLACESYVSTYDPTAEEADAPAVKQAVVSVVEALISAGLECVNDEDMHGMSALERAIDSDCPLKVVKKLQKASEKAWKATTKSVLASSVEEDLFTEMKPIPSMTPTFGSRQQRKKRNNRSMAATSA